jgi:peptidoglycan/xylan/chitin deacetylase (PgdA/CDA1 family)
LRSNGYPILRLGEAVEALSDGRLPPCATVITMDDGWLGVFTVGLPLIREFRLPVTLYVPTYYIEHPMPVFTVALSYLFWRTKAPRVDLPRGLGTFALAAQAEEAEAVAQEFGARLPPSERLNFLREVAEALGVSFAEIERRRLFRMVDEQQLRQLAQAGVDIELHSHHHDWPLDDREKVECEIRENRKFLERFVSHPLEHFCYPSGVYGLHQGEWLAALGVRTATTIEPGLNYPDTPRFALRKRRLLSLLRRRFRPPASRGGSRVQKPDGPRQTVV